MLNLDDPVATVLKVANLLERDEIAYGLYGGLAVAAWGVPRETKDADLAVVSCDVSRLAELLSGEGLDVRTAFSRVRFGGLFVSRVTLLGGENASGLNTVDLVEPASMRYAALAVGRAIRAPLRDTEITLLTPEDVVIFKVLSTREKDLEDATGVLHRLPAEIDMASIDDELATLATEIPSHDVLKRWSRCRTER